MRHFRRVAASYEQAVGWGPLKLLRERERAAVLELCDFADPAAKSAIDVGCGGGFYALAAKQAGLRVCASDVVPEMVERLKGRVDETCVADVESLSLASRHDIVVCAGALDFVLRPDQAIRALAGLLEPRGRLVILAARSGPWSLLYRAEKWLSGLSVNGFNLEWFRMQARDCGLSLVRWVHPLPFNIAVLLVPRTADAPRD